MIEAGFAAASPGDFDAVNTIASEIDGPTICSLARCNESDIEKANEALEGPEYLEIKKHRVENSDTEYGTFVVVEGL